MQEPAQRIVRVDHPDDAAVREVAAFREHILQQISRVVIGQREVLDYVLTALLSGGHCLITGVPGLAKTLIVRSLGELLDLKFSRIQFTPDLMPSDILGTEVLEEDRATGHRQFRFAQGPIFANLVLADEINRTPPKTQSALLEAMQEHHVTTCGRTLPLPPPFFVIATQNPIEQAGTYGLPEAQLDRFMFNLPIGFLSEEDEVSVVLDTTGQRPAALKPLVNRERLLFYQGLVRSVPVSHHVALYAVRIAAATRPVEGNPFPFVKKWVTWGAGIRGGQQIILAAKAWALLHGQYHVSADDVRRLAVQSLRHRVITNYFAESEGATPDKIIQEIISKLPEPKSGIR
ncbi:MAG: MoxR family ATPase [Candidatus Hydrogenedentes bacterium]|nr:MoxR family ATPase [Candidatus Hydrogenedentota bacterium]